MMNRVFPSPIPVIVLIVAILGFIPNSHGLFSQTEANPSKLDQLKSFRKAFIALRSNVAGQQLPASFDFLHPRTANPVIVKVTRRIEINKFEVTQDLWESIMGSNPSRWKGPRNSVEMLTFAEAREFCRKVTIELRKAKLIESNQMVRLPTEIEWEFFARANTSTVYSFGDDVDDLDQYAWHTGNAAGNDPPVGAKKPNPWGLFDVHGYLWEWCVRSDSADGKSKELLIQPTGEKGFEKKVQPVLRSGSWKDPAKKLTSRFRMIVKPDLVDDAVGLRPVLDTIKKK